MAAKTKSVSKAKPQPKKAAKKPALKKEAPKKKASAQNAKTAAGKPVARPVVKEAKPDSAPVQKAEKKSAPPKKPVPLVVKRVTLSGAERRPPKKPLVPQRSSQFSFMKKPGAEYQFEVGDVVEVFCDHEKNRDRIRGWVKGVIVQVDHKLAAVQFRSNVYLTDGWMVPDRILWFPVNSEHIRPAAPKKTVEKKDFIPDY